MLSSLLSVQMNSLLYRLKQWDKREIHSADKQNQTRWKIESNKQQFLIKQRHPRKSNKKERRGDMFYFSLLGRSISTMRD